MLNNSLRLTLDYPGSPRIMGDSRAVVGKHPDLMVGPPTSTVFPTNDRNFEISQFFAKNFEAV
jgi:hypothetical protein